jgi:hypothetical protein
MKVIEILEELTRIAKKFRLDREYFNRNNHMHDTIETPSQQVVDAVLTGFINSVGMNYGVDYALYASDLRKEK